MCGIVAAIAEREVSKILLEGIKRLEYRGYDSAGIALMTDTGIERIRTQGKVDQLEAALAQDPLKGRLGIAHTRWATHGKPSIQNAHPHMSGNEVALVHNGIIENFESLRIKLKKRGYTCTSDTDSEVIAHLIHYHAQQTQDFVSAVKRTVAELRGAYALAMIHKDYPDTLIGVRHGSPLVIGLGIGENFLASDNLALLPVTQQFIFLEEGDLVILSRDQYTILDAEEKEVTRAIYSSTVNHQAIDRGHYRHFMEKEIDEQPEVLADTLQGRISADAVLVESFGHEAPALFKKAQHIQIIACGTSYHAGMVARYWLESLAKIPCQVEVASEFRYREPCLSEQTLVVTISQSGETADTLAALRAVKKSTCVIGTLAICNVPESALVRASDLVFMTRAGAEVGVASTKAFTTQLVALLLLTLSLAKVRNIDIPETDIIADLRHLPTVVRSVLDLNEPIKQLAASLRDKHHALFLGRGAQYPIALEGALKLKEISYIHAEAYPAGELKHGPLALVDENMPIIALGPNDQLMEKLKSNLQEVSARGGELIVFADQALKITASASIHVLLLPDINPYLAPIVYTIPLQLLAYHAAVFKGTDVDKPRNLAKSVTVE